MEGSTCGWLLKLFFLIIDRLVLEKDWSIKYNLLVAIFHVALLCSCTWPHIVEIKPLTLFFCFYSVLWQISTWISFFIRIHRELTNIHSPTYTSSKTPFCSNFLSMDTWTLGLLLALHRFCRGINGGLLSKYTPIYFYLLLTHVI